MHSNQLRCHIKGLSAGLILVGLVSLSPVTVSAQSGGPSVPVVPDPIAVSLDPATTAVLVADVNGPRCPDAPDCVVVQPIGNLLAKARATGVTVAFSSYSAAVSPPAEIAPQGTEPFIIRPPKGPAWEELVVMFRDKNINTIVMTGNSLSQYVQYASYELATRYDFTIVVPEDTTWAESDYRTAATYYQLLNQASQLANPDNTPLKERSVTLTRSDLVSFG